MFCPDCGIRLTAEWLGAGPKPDSPDDIKPVCTQCGYVRIDSPSLVATVMLLDDDRVLLARPHGLHLPVLIAGYVERFETVEEAAVREVKEETGLDAHVEYLLGTYSMRAMGTNQVAATSVARLVGGELRIQGSELAEAGWHSLNDLPAWPNEWPIGQMFEDLARRRD